MQAHKNVFNRLAVLCRHLTTRPSSSFSSFKYPRLPQVSVNKERAEAEVIVPGYSYGDLDRTGKVNMWKVGQKGEFARVSVHQSHTDFSFVNHDHLVFMVGCHYSFTAAFYAQHHLNQPLRYVYWNPHVGTSSYTEYQECYGGLGEVVGKDGVNGGSGSGIPDQGELLHTETVNIVAVARETRKPIPLPDEVRAFILHSPDIPWEAPPKAQALRRPDNIRPSPHLVKWSNADYYEHSNHTQYLKYVMDGIWDAGLDVSDKISSIQGLYQGETKPGDRLLLYPWQSDDNTIHVQVDRPDNGDGNKTVFQATVNIDTMK